MDPIVFFAGIIGLFALIGMVVIMLASGSKSGKNPKPVARIPIAAQQPWDAQGSGRGNR